jgi:hypothetical protein
VGALIHAREFLMARPDSGTPFSCLTCTFLRLVTLSTRGALPVDNRRA